MSILSTNKKLISIGSEYSAGQGIDITNHIISVVESAVGANYSAGPNIDIYDVEGQPTISSKDWTNDIEQASANAYEQAIAQIPAPQDLSYLSGRIDTNTSGIDYISSVCLTAHQDWTDTIKGASSYSYEQSTSYFENWIGGQYTGDITNITNKVTALSSDLDNYYKKTETSSKDEINDALQYVSANAGKVYEGVSPIVVNNTEDKISAETWTFSAGSNVSFVDDNVNKITRIDVALPTPQDLSYISAQTDKANQGVDYLSGVVITALPSDMATTGDVAELAQTISETYYPNTNPSSFVNEDWVTAQGYITGVDLSEYAERAFVLSSIESATSGKLDVSSFASVSSDFLTNEDLDSYYTKSETSGADQLADAFANIPAGDVGVNTYVQNNSATISEVNTTYQSNSSNYITAHQSLDGYATEDWVTGQGYLTGVSIPESATWNEVSTTVQTNSSVWNDKLDSSSLDLAVGHPVDFAPGITGAYRISGADIIATNALADSEGRVFDGWYQLKDNNLLSGTKYGTLKIDNENTHLVDTTFSALSSYDGILTSAIPESGVGFYNGGIFPDNTKSTTSHNYDNVKSYSINIQSWDSGFTAQINGTNYNHSYFDGNNSQTITGEFNTPSTLVVKLSRGNNYMNPQINQFDLGVVGQVNEVVDIRDVFATKSALPTYQYDDYNKISAINGSAIAGQGGAGNPEVESYVQTNSGTIDETVTSYQTNSGTFLTAHQAISAGEWNDCYDNVNTNSGAWGGSALPISAGPGISLNIVDDTLVVRTIHTGYVWTSASLFSTDTPTLNTNYTLSDSCSNYDKLEVDFYDINDWRTQMDCPIPQNLAASGTRGGYFSVVPSDTTTSCNIWFKCFNWTAAQNTWTCYCSEIAGQGGSTTQTVNANQPSNPPKVIQIIGWKRVLV